MANAFIKPGRKGISAKDLLKASSPAAVAKDAANTKNVILEMADMIDKDTGVTGIDYVSTLGPKLS